MPSWFCCTGLLGGGNGLLVSRSAAKDLQPPGRINENLGIMRFCSVWMRVIRAFVADLDTRPTSGPSSNSWRCPLGSWCPSPGSRWCSLNVTSGRAPSGRLLHEGRGVLVRGCAYCTRPGPSWSAPEHWPVAPHPRAVRAGCHRSDQARPFGEAIKRLSRPGSPNLSQMPRPRTPQKP